MEDNNKKEKQNFLISIINNENPNDIKNLLAIIGGNSLIGLTIWYHTDTLIYTTATLIASCLGISAITEIFKKN